MFTFRGVRSCRTCSSKASTFRKQWCLHTEVIEACANSNILGVFKITPKDWDILALLRISRQRTECIRKIPTLNRRLKYYIKPFFHAVTKCLRANVLSFFTAVIVVFFKDIPCSVLHRDYFSNIHLNIFFWIINIIITARLELSDDTVYEEARWLEYRLTRGLKTNRLFP